MQVSNFCCAMFSYKSYISLVTQAHGKTTVIGMVPTTGKKLKRSFLRKIEKGIHVTQQFQIIVEVF